MIDVFTVIYELLKPFEGRVSKFLWCVFYYYLIPGFQNQGIKMIIVLVFYYITKTSYDIINNH